MRVVVALVLLSSCSMLWAQREGDSHAHGEPDASAEQVVVEVTINPETRLSARRGAAYPPVVACGTAAEMPVRIVNQGFVTASLQAHLVEPAPEGVELMFAPTEPLSGRAEEKRVLRVTLAGQKMADVTIAFRTRGDIPNLSGADQVSLLVRCFEP